MALIHFFFLAILISMFDAAIESNPDGSCTNPKFRWFPTLNAFYNYTKSTPNNKTIPALRVNVSLNTNARCLDGSQYMFYFREGFGDGLSKYQIYLQGGAWCTSYDACYRRGQPSNYLGSSAIYTDYAWFSADYLNDNQTKNPLLYNWNSIWMIYCDGSSFTGNNMTIYKYKVNNTYSADLYFRGHINLKEGMKLLYNQYGLNTASDIVLSGCSAGGMAVYLNNDYIFNNFVNENAAKSFLSIPASGFFPYNNPIHSNNWHENILWIYNTQNVTNNLNEDCVNYYKQINESLLSNCMFSQYVSRFLNKNKVFALQSIYDIAGMKEQHINTTNETQVNLYGEWYAGLFVEYFINTNINLHGALLYSCNSHCGEFDNINVSNILSGSAIEMFYYGNQNTYFLFQNESFPCNDCCFATYIVPSNVTMCDEANELCNPICTS